MPAEQGVLGNRIRERPPTFAEQEGFNAETTVGELSAWWLDHVARHRVRPTSLATYRKHVTVIDAQIGTIPVRKLRPEQATTFVSDLIDAGSASRARNVRTLLVQILEQGRVRAGDPERGAQGEGSEVGTEAPTRDHP